MLTIIGVERLWLFVKENNRFHDAELLKLAYIVMTSIQCIHNLIKILFFNEYEEPRVKE